MNYKYMGETSCEEIQTCMVNTYFDYDGNEITLPDGAIEMFTDVTNAIKKKLNCTTRIVNGNLEFMCGSDSEQAILGTNIDRGELIIIDNLLIYEAYNFKACFKELVKTICHEIAHNKYDFHGRWHSKLTADYFQSVYSLIC